MRRYVSRRLVQFIPTFFGMTIVVFILLQLAPGDPLSVQTDVTRAFDAESIESWRRLKGLDQPLLLQYLDWLRRFVTFDFGRSFISERPVGDVIAEALPNSMILTGSALLWVYLLAIPLGLYSALRRGTMGDRVLSVTLFVLYSMPVFWVALLLIVLLAGGQFLTIFPLRGLASPGMEDAGFLLRFLDTVWHLVLPVGCLAYPALARTSRFQRTATLDVLSKDFIRTARAKGLRERDVVRRHVLKSSLLPVVTLLSVDLPWLIGGSVIIERIFTIRGMGMLTFDSILRRDYPVIMGVTALVGIVTMLAVLLGDLALAWLDPRIRLAGRR